MSQFIKLYQDVSVVKVTQDENKDVRFGHGRGGPVMIFGIVLDSENVEIECSSIYHVNPKSNIGVKLYHEIKPTKDPLVFMLTVKWAMNGPVPPEDKIILMVNNYMAIFDMSKEVIQPKNKRVCFSTEHLKENKIRSHYGN